MAGLLQTDRYEEYPKLKELVMRKDALAAARATPPYYLKARPRSCCMASIKSRHGSWFVSHRANEMPCHATFCLVGSVSVCSVSCCLVPCSVVPFHSSSSRPFYMSAVLSLPFWLGCLRLTRSRCRAPGRPEAAAAVGGDVRDAL